MVKTNESTIQNYATKKRYCHIPPSFEQKKNGIADIYEDLEMKADPNSTYRYIVIYQDSEGQFYQDFVDTNEDGILSFFDNEFINERKLN